jgi:protein-tyrosine phosphatase
MDIPTIAETTAILDAIDEALDSGETVYVHCWGGHGRTGTVIGCWLVRYGTTAGDAIELIRERRRSLPVFDANPLSPQTRDQHAFVYAWSPGR